MAIASIMDEGVAGAHAGLAHEFARVAERLRRSTVGVRGHGPGGGSGVIWRPDGLIITNAHVAHGPHAVVELWDGRSLEARVTARDPRRDLASLQVDAADLPAAPIADSDTLRVGELALAVGNPLGVAGALTAGIIHAVGPSGKTGERRGQTWVQADVRLAPGNSGGPLADARGRVIGINSMIAGGLALAVPGNDVERFLSTRGERPYLGVDVQPVRLSVSGQPALGLLLLSVVPAGPAEAAGLLIGDVLAGANGGLFSEPADLAVVLHQAGADGTIRLDVVRAGRLRTVEVTVGRAAPAEAEAA